jgi:hypothetical protein
LKFGILKTNVKQQVSHLKYKTTNSKSLKINDQKKQPKSPHKKTQNRSKLIGIAQFYWDFAIPSDFTWILHNLEFYSRFRSIRQNKIAKL